MRLLHDSSKAFEQQHWLPPEAPYWYPEPPEIDDSNPFPWMFVKGMGWVCCNNNFGLNWFDLEEPKPDPHTQVELVNAVLYWQKHVESEKDVLLAKMQEEDQQRGPPKGAVDVMCHACGPPFRLCVCGEAEERAVEIVAENMTAEEVTNKMVCSVV